jgi:hypothetical protein
MLTIRESQLRVLAQNAFERWLVQHVIRCFPECARNLSNDELVTLIREKRVRATRYFSSESGISAFIDLSCLFGDNFDQDPGLPLAREILKRPAIDDAERGRMLYQKARTHLLRSRSLVAGDRHA